MGNKKAKIISYFLKTIETKCTANEFSGLFSKTFFVFYFNWRLRNLQILKRIKYIACTSTLPDPPVLTVLPIILEQVQQ